MSNLDNATRYLPLDSIRPNPEQPRQIKDADYVGELAVSIAERGVLQPISVRPDPSDEAEYIIVAGENRYRASRLAGLDSIPAVVRDDYARDIDAYVDSLIENVSRRNMNPIDEARGFAKLRDEYDPDGVELTQGEVAKIAGVSRVTVTERLRLLDLDPQAQTLLTTGQVGVAAGNALAKLDRNGQAIVMRGIGNGKLSTDKQIVRAANGVKARLEAAAAADAQGTLAGVEDPDPEVTARNRQVRREATADWTSAEQAVGKLLATIDENPAALAADAGLIADRLEAMAANCASRAKTLRQAAAADDLVAA